MKENILDLINDIDFNEYFNKRLGTEVNPNLPQELYNKSELKLIKDIAKKAHDREIFISSKSVKKLLDRTDVLCK